MKQIAVFGSNGQLGRTLQSLVAERDESYIFYSKGEVDITNKESVEQVFKSNNFKFCINCAAYTNVESAEKDSEQAFLVNANGVKNLAELCNLNGIKLIHISTDYVFDGKKKIPYSIDDKTNPINEYGRSKLKGELYISNIIKEYYIIRASWLYSIYGKNFLTTIIEKLKSNSNLKITTEQEGTPTSCLELSEFIMYLVNTQDIPYGIYNFSAKGSTTWYGFAKEIGNLLFPDRIENITAVDSFETIAKRPKYSVLDISRTEEVYKNLGSWQLDLEKLVKN